MLNGPACFWARRTWAVRACGSKATSSTPLVVRHVALADVAAEQVVQAQVGRRPHVQGAALRERPLDEERADRNRPRRPGLVQLERHLQRVGAGLLELDRQDRVLRAGEAD